MKKKEQNRTAPPLERAVSQGRHEAQCKVCAHGQRQEIEEYFVEFRSSVDDIAEQHGVSRDAVYRHAHVFGLFDKRRRNVGRALELIIEQASEAKVDARAVVAAVGVYARLNSNGQLIERQEVVNVNALFDKMSGTELEAYAKDGSLPGWFQAAVGATRPAVSEGRNVESTGT